MLARLRDDDEGFTLVETVAAMVVFALLAVSVANVVLRTFGVTRSNTARVVAANLASQQIETVRAMRAVDVPDGAVEVTPKPVVNGTTFTVRRTATYVAADSTTSACTGPSASSGVRLAYKLITVDVRWPGMGATRPVRQDTLLSLGIGFAGVDGSLGSGAIAVTGADGQPRSGVTVTLSPGGTVVTTGTDGCAVFTGLTPGTAYTATVDQAGWVGTEGMQRVVTAAFGVTASGVTRIVLPYDRAGTLAVTVAGQEGLAPPPAVGLTLASGNFAGSEQPFPDCSGHVTAPFHCVSGQPRTTQKLFPGQYGAWVGSCTDARPASHAPSVVTAASTTSVTIPAHGVRAVVMKNGTPVTGHTVYAIHASDGVCLARSWPMSPASHSHQSLALPLGTWTLALNAEGKPLDSGVPWPTVTLVEGQSIPTVSVPAP